MTLNVIRLYKIVKTILIINLGFTVFQTHNKKEDSSERVRSSEINIFLSVYTLSSHME
jgi:hypothetical protein